MVQKEVRHKTKLYTVAAVLLALVLVSSIYVATTSTSGTFGSTHQTFGISGPTGVSTMKTFASTNELKNYLLTNTQYAVDVPERDNNDPNVSDSLIGDLPASGGLSSAAYMSRDSSSGGYSLTNVQVAGVDEADLVKTDGQYIYAVVRYYPGTDDDGYPSFEMISSGVRPIFSIQIIKADSKALPVVGKIDFDAGTSDNLYLEAVPNGVYLSENGNKLTVLGTHWSWARRAGSFIYVYDVSNRANPVLTRNMTFSGSYFNSRMIGDYVYAVISQPASVSDGTVALPKISIDEVTCDIASNSVYYCEIQRSPFSYNTFIGFNMVNDAEQPTSMTILMGVSSCMYVSTNNMYVTFQNTDGNTEIYRIAINGVNLTFEAQSIISGYVLNQYSMDEYNNYFRITTTITTETRSSNKPQHNNLYVLDMDLNEVGKIESFAQDERIYATRFVGNKAYVVTFKKIDPFFIIDLKDPTSPKIAGELKIPGYSSYLHPYNENYIIGIGLEEDKFVKLSLFDVTDIKNPTEIAKYVINRSVSTSKALSDPKALLFNPQKQLLVIPISLPERVDPKKPTWNGVYLFNVSPETGFTLKKEIDHPLTLQIDNTSFTSYLYINRAIYIGNSLYTISHFKIQLHNLDDYTLITQRIFN